MKIDIMIEDLVIESVEFKENFVAEVIDESVEWLYYCCNMDW